jgi:hypothetical protein
MSLARLPRSQTLEVADIFRAAPDYLRQHGRQLSLRQAQTFQAILDCRTAALGGHVDRCLRCGVERIAYNSCRNRHCPRCQFLQRERWLRARQRDLLPISYFHVVFTLPDVLNELIWRNPRRLFGLLFRAVADTLTTAAANPRWLGAEIGFLAILHTWGQKLTAHPHLHCIVTGGGLAENHWIAARSDFFLPVRVLSRLFRGKFLAGLRALHGAGKLACPGSLAALSDPVAFRTFLRTLYTRDWVVYCKEPFQKPEALLAYLGRYTHRVAITSGRLLDFDGESVRIQYRDYAAGGQLRACTLRRDEFIRRFLMHILPRRFVKIRHYGLLANRKRRLLLDRIRQLLAAPPPQPHLALDWRALLYLATGVDVTRCEVCGAAAMVLFRELAPLPRPP